MKTNQAWFDVGDFMQVGYTQVGNYRATQRYGLFCEVLKRFNRYQTASYYVEWIAENDDDLDHVKYLNWMVKEGYIKLLRLNRVWNLGEPFRLAVNHKDEGLAFDPEIEIEYGYDTETGYITKASVKESHD